MNAKASASRKIETNETKFETNETKAETCETKSDTTGMMRLSSSTCLMRLSKSQKRES